MSQAVEDQIDSLVDDSPDRPGGAVAVVRNGTILYARGYGMADLERRTVNTPTTVFNTGSVSKQFTAFLILLLEADGLLSLDDEVHQHLPELHSFAAPITLRRLLHHTSGLRDTYPDLLLLAGWRFTDTITQEDCLRLIRRQRGLSFPPGTEHLYVNANYVLLAEVAARVGGASFADLSRERIFEPLGMVNSRVHDRIDLVIPNRAVGYWVDDQGEAHNLPLVDSVLGSTNVYSTAEDLARWAANLETAAVGGATVRATLFTSGALDDGTPVGYGGGLEVGLDRNVCGRRSIEHGGQHGGYGAYVLHLPDDGLSVVALYNQFMWAARELPAKVAELFIGGSRASHETVAEPGNSAGPDVEAAAGAYFDAARGNLREIEVRDDGTPVFLPFRLELIPLDEQRFTFAEEPTAVVEIVEGGIRVLSGGQVYEYERVERRDPGPAAQYTGRYWSAELGVVWTIRASGEVLRVSRAREPETDLTHLFGDTFSDDWERITANPMTFTVTFERNSVGEVTGFRVTGSRARGVEFHRLA